MTGGQLSPKQERVKVQLWLLKEEKERYAALAEAEGKDLSKLIRELLRKYAAEKGEFFQG